MNFNNKYLKDNLEILKSICDSWALSPQDFVKKIESWFANFESSDYNLAIKILKEIDYYNEERIYKTLEQIWKDIKRKVAPKTLFPAKVILIVPEGYGDSAHSHAYMLTKILKIAKEQICPVNKLPKNIEDNTVIAFNDTYGTGNQFVNDIVKKTKLRCISKTNWVFVVGLTISKTARNYISRELPDAHILPETSPKTIYEVFNYEDAIKIEQLGADIYPPHPLGYGGAGLLVAYNFQCPNNSIPLIWANSETQNNEFEGYTYPWNSLWEYKSKTKLPETSRNRKAENEKSEEKYKPETHTSGDDVKKIFRNRTNLAFTDEELNKVNEILDKWQCGLKSHNDIVSGKLTKWFNNFEFKDKALALKILSEIQYLSLAKTREEIVHLRDKVLSVVKRTKDKKMI